MRRQRIPELLRFPFQATKRAPRLEEERNRLQTVTYTCDKRSITEKQQKNELRIREFEFLIGVRLPGS